jgi:hypothetical protein
MLPVLNLIQMAKVLFLECPFGHFSLLSCFIDRQGVLMVVFHFLCCQAFTVALCNRGIRENAVLLTALQGSAILIVCVPYD